MQRAWLLLVITGLIIGLIWWQRPADGQLEEMVPADLAGLVMVNRFPDSLDFLPQTRLGEWLNDDAGLFKARLAEQAEGEWFSVLKESLERACLVVHTLEQKESGAYRPHVTAYLWPLSGRSAAVEEWIQTKVVERFGVDRTTIVQEGAVRVFRGEAVGEVLYLSHERGYLIVSNSESGWKNVQLALAGRAPNLGERRSYKDVRNRIDQDIDLFFYFSGAVAHSLLPEFGYGVRVDKDQVTDLYWEVPPGEQRN